MTDRATARVVGALFLVGTVAGLVGLPLQESVVGGRDYLSAASAHPDRLATGVLLQLVMGVAVVSIAVVIYPVLRRGTERLAMGYVVARALEPLSTPQVVLEAPLGLQEIALALWLIVKGFDTHEPSASQCQQEELIT